MKSTFEVVSEPFAPNGGDVTVWFYQDCTHRWWQRAYDSIRHLHRHPKGHNVAVHTFAAVTGGLKMVVKKDGMFTLEDAD
jgi:hypothetical protein